MATRKHHNYEESLAFHLKAETAITRIILKVTEELRVISRKGDKENCVVVNAARTVFDADKITYDKDGLVIIFLNCTALGGRKLTATYLPDPYAKKSAKGWDKDKPFPVGEYQFVLSRLEKGRLVTPEQRRRNTERMAEKRAMAAVAPAATPVEPTPVAIAPVKGTRTRTTTRTSTSTRTSTPTHVTVAPKTVRMHKGPKNRWELWHNYTTGTVA